ncbi:MAG: SDR family NAD(P)-dependent oxidoreductase [Chthonomonadales bacterium]
MGNRSLRNRVVVVTGASAGIGREAARLFSREGSHVVAAARRRNRLEELCSELSAAGARCLAVTTDVSQRDQVQRLLDATLEHFGRVDVWVNNAGCGLAGPIEATSEQDLQQILAVNFMGVFHGCQVALQQMRRQGNGHIINVSSLITKFPLPFHGAYTAAKCAVNGLTEALALELEGSGIRVSLILPGVTDTEFTQAMVRRMEDAPSGPSIPAASAGRVARAIVHCARKPRPVVTCLPAAPVVTAFFELCPSLWRMAARQYRKVRGGA